METIPDKTCAAGVQGSFCWTAASKELFQVTSNFGDLKPPPAVIQQLALVFNGIQSLLLL